MNIITKNLRLFWQGTVLSYVALFAWFRPVTYAASKILMPLAQIIFFTFLGSYASGGTDVDFYVIGNAIQITAVSGIFGVTMSIGGDRWAGTLPYLFGTPANRMMLFFGRAFMHIIDGAFGVVIALGWGALLFGVDFSHTDFSALGLTIIVTTTSTCGLGLLMGCLSLITANVMFVNNTVYFLLLIFSGANIAIDTLPNWMQAFSKALPLTRGIASARTLIAGGSFADVAPLLVSEIGIGIAYGILGYFLFTWFELHAKRKGTLETV
ncbi:MAG: ABC transporter permease [Anaerolineae bacterium]|jgi:ABC-2 type transport system permease protein|nr:ABC transporter permease [Anaerolineae bacterium]MBT7191561.1 ABC transporter permease [Anaerolineae bacterium]MBT7989296.1 ABC transporter permease [Anaerolineae bacterium]